MAPVLSEEAKNRCDKNIHNYIVNSIHDAEIMQFATETFFGPRFFEKQVKIFK